MILILLFTFITGICLGVGINFGLGFEIKRKDKKE